MTRAKGWKFVALASSIALAAAFVAYRVASAKPEAGTPPATPPATAPAEKPEPTPAWFGGSKSMILVDPEGKPSGEATYTLPTPAPQAPAPQAPAK